MSEVQEHDDPVHHAVPERDERVYGPGLEPVEGLGDNRGEYRHLPSFFPCRIAVLLNRTPVQKHYNSASDANTMEILLQLRGRGVRFRIGIACCKTRTNEPCGGAYGPPHGTERFLEHLREGFLTARQLDNGGAFYRVVILVEGILAAQADGGRVFHRVDNGLLVIGGFRPSGSCPRRP